MTELHAATFVLSQLWFWLIAPLLITILSHSIEYKVAVKGGLGLTAFVAGSVTITIIIMWAVMVVFS